MSKALKKLIDINRLREFKNKLVGMGSAYVQTAAVDQTIAGTKTFSKPIVGSVTGSSGSCTGNAATATKATQDSAGQQINTTYIKGLAVSGRTITYTKGDGSTGTITTQDTNTWTAFKGATSSANGTAGYVPAPTKGNQGKFFKADGTWATPPNTTYASMSASEATTGTATAARTISAKVLHDKINSNLSAYATKTELNNGLTTKANDSAVVHKSGDETIAGTKTFSSQIKGNISGSASSVPWSGVTGKPSTFTPSSHTHDDRYYTETEVNNLLNGKANDNAVVHKSGNESIAGTKTFNDTVHANTFHSTNPNAFIAQRDSYTFLIRNDGANTYLLMSDKDGVPGTWSNARPLVISNSRGVCDINGSAATATRATNADHATKADSATKAANAGHATKADSATKASSADRAATADRATNANHATSADSATKAIILKSNSSDDHDIRFDWSRQVDGRVGIRVDATDLGGIVTTDRLVSDIRAQWYAAYPDGAEAHNAMWGGRNITAAFNNGTVSANIKNGTFKDIFPGDYITKSVTIGGKTYTVNWVVADCDYWINKGDTAMTAHHVAIVPQQPIFNAKMNSTNTTDGGYASSWLRMYVITDCAKGLVSAFGSDHILEFRDGITDSVDTSHVSSGIPQWTGTPGWWGAWVSTRCSLMSEKMVYGAPICAAGAMDNTMANRQMSAFRLSERLINPNRQAWWLRDVVSSAHFANVGGAGNARAGGASDVGGVRPFALLV